MGDTPPSSCKTDPPKLRPSWERDGPSARSAQTSGLSPLFTHAEGDATKLPFPCASPALSYPGTSSVHQEQGARFGTFWVEALSTH